MKTHLLITFWGVLACCSCSNSYDLLENDIELAGVAEDYELSTRAMGEEGNMVKVETVADEQSIQASMNEYVEGLMNRQTTAKQKVMRTAYAATTEVVGVFKVGSCGTYSELDLVIDAEDSRSQSSITGNVGDTYIDDNGNPVLKFCLTEANQYYPGGVFLVDHIDYWQFDGMLDVLVRSHDSEDDDTDNSVAFCGDPRYQSISDISQGYTCIDDNATLAWAFPHRPLSEWAPITGIGPKNYIKYGLLAGALMGRKGQIHIDDEDSRNQNWLKKYSGYNFVTDLSNDQAFYGINAEGNTDYFLVLSTDKEFKENNAYYPNHNPSSN